MARLSRPFLALTSLLCLALAGRGLAACAGDDDDVLGAGSDDGGGTTADAERSDGSTEEEGDAGRTPDAAKKPDSPFTEECPGKPKATHPGETCIGFGSKGSSCNDACGRPYGYVCVDGGPPGFPSCVRASASSLGETYCCTTNECVAQPDRDSVCNGASGKPHSYACPPHDDGGTASKPGCEQKSDELGVPLFCCP